jgi:hypothetical protein
MNTKLLMTVSALFLGIIGISLSFLPEEIISHFDADGNVIIILILQLLGALYLGFGILNWMAKGSTIGGIFNKPIVIGNLMHFSITAIALIKLLLVVDTHFVILLIFSVIYTVFTLSFIYIFRTNPAIK